MAEPEKSDDPPPLSFLGRMIGHSRFVVFVPVVAVLLVAFSLFLLGTIQAVSDVWAAWYEVLGHHAEVSKLSAKFLKTVIVMLEAVVFFLIGVGMYSLFIAPLNLAVALGVETLYDLEERIISVVIAVLAVTFLQHFIEWSDPLETLQFGGALAVTVAALVFFQFNSRRAKEDQKSRIPDTQDRSRRDMFEHQEEEHDIKPDELEPSRKEPGR